MSEFSALAIQSILLIEELKNNNVRIRFLRQRAEKRFLPLYTPAETFEVIRLVNKNNRIQIKLALHMKQLAANLSVI